MRFAAAVGACISVCWEVFAHIDILHSHPVSALGLDIHVNLTAEWFRFSRPCWNLASAMRAGACWNRAKAGHTLGWR